MRSAVMSCRRKRRQLPCPLLQSWLPSCPSPLAEQHLGCGGLLLPAEVGKAAALFREAPQQRSGCPELSVSTVEMADAFKHVLQPHSVRIPHGTAAIRGEAVAIDVDDVDIDRAQGEALLKDVRAFIHQRIHAAIDDLLLGNVALRDIRFRSPIANHAPYFRIGNGAAILIVLVPTCPGLLTIAADFAKAIGGKRPPDSLLFEMPVLLANAPAYIETGEIAGR